VILELDDDYVTSFLAPQASVKLVQRYLYTGTLVMC
jgi:hypothetical protein